MGVSGKTKFSGEDEACKEKTKQNKIKREPAHTCFCPKLFVPALHTVTWPRVPPPRPRSGAAGSYPRTMVTPPRLLSTPPYCSSLLPASERFKTPLVSFIVEAKPLARDHTPTLPLPLTSAHLPPATCHAGPYSVYDSPGYATPAFARALPSAWRPLPHAHVHLDPPTPPGHLPQRSPSISLANEGTSITPCSLPPDFFFLRFIPI